MEPLTVWENEAGQSILVDGHNRYRICGKHGLPYSVRKMPFKDIEAAKIWMLENQMGRRNLTPDQISYYRGLRYLSMKQIKGGYKSVQFQHHAKFAEGLSIISRSNPGLKLKILSGEVSVKKADIQALTNAKNAEELVIKNEADLYNRAKAIREEVFNEIEMKVKRLNKERIDAARKSMDEREPAFLGKDDRIRKTKGLIISAMNEATKGKDIQSINKLKKLIDKLADIILE